VFPWADLYIEERPLGTDPRYDIYQHGRTFRGQYVGDNGWGGGPDSKVQTFGEHPME
jgi:hypothetical protein